MSRGRERLECVTVVALAQANADANGVAAFNIAPGNGLSFISDSSTKLAALSDLFTYYRVKKLIVRVHPGMPNSPAAFDYQAFGCVPGNIQSAPTSLTTVLDLPWSRLISPNVSSDNVCSVVREFNVPRKHFTGQVPWFKTILNGSVDNQLEICGQIYTFGEASSTHRLETEVTYEFKEFVGPAQNPFKSRTTHANREWVELADDEKSTVSDRGGGMVAPVAKNAAPPPRQRPGK